MISVPQPFFAWGMAGLTFIRAIVWVSPPLSVRLAASRGSGIFRKLDFAILAYEDGKLEAKWVRR